MVPVLSLEHLTAPGYFQEFPSRVISSLHQDIAIVAQILNLQVTCL